MKTNSEETSRSTEPVIPESEQKRLLIKKLQKAQNLTLEATFLSSWQSFGIKFDTSLAVTAGNFNPQLKGQIRCEPVVLCQVDGGRVRVLSVEDFETALMDVRQSSTCEDWPAKGLFDKDQPAPVLLGVSNLSLAPLAYDVRFSHVAPVFGTQGEITARLHWEIRRLIVPDSSSCEIRIREVNELPEDFNQFVFCQYRFPGEDETTFALPAKQFRHLCAPGAIPFNHSMVYKLTDSSIFSSILPIEVWGHQRRPPAIKRDNFSLVKQIGDKWRSFKCLLMLSVGMKELGDGGVWNSLQTTLDSRVSGCAGFYKLRQGHSHIITVKVRPIRTPGSLPISISEIAKIEVGCVRCCKSPISSQMDSYHEEDLITLREIWLKALDERKLLLKKQIEASNDCEAKEQNLINQLVSLTEERNIAELPPPGSGIPGSPADWVPPPGIEKHSPLLLLLNRDRIDIPITEERQDEFLPLNFTTSTGETPKKGAAFLRAECHWDPTSHESAWLNQASDPDVFVFLIVRVHVRLKAGSFNGDRTIIFRKRVPVQITRRSSSTWFTKFLPQSGSSGVYETGVIYELISHLPHALMESEPRDQLARLAAHSASDSSSKSTDLLDQYLAHIGELDELLLDDQRRQRLLLTDALMHAGRKSSDTIPIPVAEKMPNASTTGTIYFDAPSEQIQEDDDAAWRNDSSLDRPPSPTDSEKTLKVDSVCEEEPSVMNGRTPSPNPTAQLSPPPPLSETFSKENRVSTEVPLPEWLTTGQRVIVCTNSVNRKPGIVQYVGPTAIRKGIWIGVELDSAQGKNDGSYKGKRYFICQPDHGVFVRPDKLVKEE